YTFRTGMRPSEVIEMLVEGRYTTITVTIPEGFTVSQIARIFQEKGLGREETFLALSVDFQFIQSLHIKGNSLEGFLFPDTYQFRKGMGEDAILREMVGRFKQVYSDAYRKRADELGLSQNEVITLASIIEKETSEPSERYIIGAVFQNRLKKGIPLQSDPTVIYGIKDFDGNLTKEDLQTETPFNTYLIKGLPPQPIANPGEESIKASLYPSQDNYLYFVSKNNGTHQFSATLEEHNRAVDTYQRKRRRRK
ncbi:MAG: endolytic transglycosylase MltG, partial [Thermodesulfobacteriota bacterium]|nr:endolytic transglycosylase MltG [Thermodesulfobacteriota bacterium]